MFGLVSTAGLTLLAGFGFGDWFECWHFDVSVVSFVADLVCCGF